MPYRRLTAGEIALARTVFQDGIDYSKVRLYDTRIFPGVIQDGNRAMALSNKISFPGTTYSPDFSLETNAVKQSVFIHELVHVWQQQTHVVRTEVEYAREMLRTRFNYQQSYFYTLDAAKDLTDYGFEQQAGIVQDYFLLKQHGVAKSFKNRRKPDAVPPDLALYEKVLARFNQDPFYGRAYKKYKRPGPKKP